jgi:hypothetical protein
MSTGSFFGSRSGIAALVPTFGEDVVAIYKQNEVGSDAQIIESSNPIRANISERATFFTHPLESGRNITDHRIIEPVEIELRLLITDGASVLGGIRGGNFRNAAADIYNEIRKLFIDGTPIAVQTRTGVYFDQIIQEMPHEETSEIFDGIIISFKSSEILVSETNTEGKNFVPVSDLDDSTVPRGRLNTSSATGSQTTNALSGV